jgi:hypothetical protein
MALHTTAQSVAYINKQENIEQFGTRNRLLALDDPVTMHAWRVRRYAKLCANDCETLCELGGPCQEIFFAFILENLPSAVLPADKSEATDSYCAPGRF